MISPAARPLDLMLSTPFAGPTCGHPSPASPQLEAADEPPHPSNASYFSDSHFPQCSYDDHLHRRCHIG
ncbi:hypothetical protein OIDMADRAFT_21559 [Oidiodendron maius Zn]|uniref:Uncharacterized protein n=1 Tax=Oidiodendron maius (strain Zn) TaxID=913774 RepID=A0A0C3GRK2_OIDMZ|nr:hypothetical protein OIDMADRAFT_21559 [Oidiodendron maius Zn]